MSDVERKNRVFVICCIALYFIPLCLLCTILYILRFNVLNVLFTVLYCRPALMHGNYCLYFHTLYTVLPCIAEVSYSISKFI